MKKYETGIFILRAQPDHLAHLDIIKKMSEMCDQLIISIGSHNRPRSIRNPWTSTEREWMLNTSICEHLKINNYKFQHIRDYMYNDYKWAAEVYSKALRNGATPDKKTCLFGHFKDDSSYYLNMFPQWDLHTLPVLHDGVSATRIRDYMFYNWQQFKQITNVPYTTDSTTKTIQAFQDTEEGKRLKEEFEYIKTYKADWASAPFPPMFVTVDSVVIKSGHILVIKRGGNPGKGLHALPGGFLNHNEHIEHGAIRELKEETKIDVPKPSLYNQIVAREVFDHPQRSLRGRTITHSFLIDLGHGALPNLKASDDAAGARWIPLADVYTMEDKFFEDHFDIIIKMTSSF